MRAFVLPKNIKGINKMELAFLSHVNTISGIEEVSVFGYLNENKKPCVKVLDRDEQEPFFEVTPKMIKLLTVEYTFRALTKLSKREKNNG